MHEKFQLSIGEQIVHKMFMLNLRTVCTVIIPEGQLGTASVNYYQSYHHPLLNAGLQSQREMQNYSQHSSTDPLRMTSVNQEMLSGVNQAMRTSVYQQKNPSPTLQNQSAPSPVISRRRESGDEGEARGTGEDMIEEEEI